MLHHIKRTTQHLIFWLLMLTALSLTTIRVFLYLIDNYRIELTNEISKRVDAPVIIGGISTQMRAYKPQLVLTDINVLSTAKSSLSQQPKKPVITLKEIRLSINLLDFLISRDFLSSSWVTLVGLKLDVKRKSDGSFGIVGLKESDEKPLWLLQTGKYEVLQSSVTWRDEQKNGKPLVFDAVDMAIINKGQQHAINVLMNLPEKYGKSLAVSMVLDGNLFEPSAINGKGFFEGQGLNLPQWMTLDLPEAIKINSGTGDFKLWFKIDHSQLIECEGETNLQDIQLSRIDKNSFASKKLSTTFNWSINNKQWQLIINRFLLETADKKWQPTAFSVSGFVAEDNLLHKLAFFSKQVDLQEATMLTQFFAPLNKQQHELLTQAHPKGLLDNFSLFIDLDKKQGAVNVSVTKLAFSPFLSVPGLTNINAQIIGSDQQGQLHVTTNNTRIIMPELFKDAIALGKLEGSLAWQNTAEALNLSIESMTVNTSDFQSKTRLQLNIPQNKQSKFMDLQTSFVSNDIRNLTHYLPKKGNLELFDWINHANFVGRISKGGVLFYGKLNDFPFKPGQGVFEVLFNAEQVDFTYHPDWPRLKGLNGEVFFSSDTFQSTISYGLSEKVTIKQAELYNPSLLKSKFISLHGVFEASFSNVFEFLKQTPYKVPSEKLSNEIISEGNTVVKLDAKLPLFPDLAAKFDGSAKLSNSKLTVKSLDLSINQINGELKFNDQGFFSDAIKAQTLGNPIQINISSNSQQNIINAEGKIKLSELEKQFTLPRFSIAEGMTDYQLQLKLPYNDTSPKLELQSTLEGLKLKLPDDLAKPDYQKSLLQMSFNLGNPAMLLIYLNYDNKLKAAIKLDILHHQIDSGKILIGSGSVTNSQKPGLRLEINRQQLDLQKWLDSGLPVSQGNDSTNVNTLKEVIIHTKNCLWKNTPLGAFDLNLNNDGNDWLGDLSSKIAKGYLKIPLNLHRDKRITLTMEQLDLAFLKQLKQQDNDEQQLAPLPDFMPLITVTSEKTFWNDMELGQLTIESKQTDEGIAFNKIDLQNLDQHLSITGDWKLQGANSRTHFKGHLKIPKAGMQFAKLGISNDLSETSAEFNININWQGMPQQFSQETLQGRLEVLLKNGRILSIEPGGLGRIIGILAMAQWVKRLQLDFSDVFEEGLSFDSIKGYFDFVKGKAETHNLVIDAIPAKITIEGSYDLLKENMDFIVSVVPNSGDAVPIAGNIIGKVASVIGQTLTGKNQDGFLFGSQYQVTGSLGNIKVLPIHENDGLLQKTWNGITSFPWTKH